MVIYLKFPYSVLSIFLSKFTSLGSPNFVHRYVYYQIHFTLFHPYMTFSQVLFLIPQSFDWSSVFRLDLLQAILFIAV